MPSDTFDNQGDVQDGGTEVRGGAFEHPRLGEISHPDPHVTVGGGPAIDADGSPTAGDAPADVPFGSEVDLNPQPIPPGKAVAPSSGVDDAAIIIVGGKPSSRRVRGIAPPT